MMQVAKKIPFENPDVLNACRGLYLVSNLIILGIYAYLKMAIDKKKGTCFSASPPPQKKKKQAANQTAPQT